MSGGAGSARKRATARDARSGESRAQHVVDEMNTNAVLLEAVDLCRRSLGDDRLWAATTRLREALTAFADREPFPWPGRWER